MKYKKEFPDGTPIVCACEKGRFEDVKLLITGGYNDVNGSNGNNNNMTLKEYVNQVGRKSTGDERIPITVVSKEDKCISDYIFTILLDGVTINVNTLTDLYKESFPKGTPLVCA